MERCSAEILHEIFALACTDGGRTGCVLSLVSRRIHYASFGVRFHTVALYGARRMRSFQRMLELQKPSLPIVKHLSLYDRQAPLWTAGWEGLLWPAASDWEGQWEPWVPEEGTLDVAISIVSTIAPSLVSLFTTYDQAIRPGSRFPLLRDLSLGASSISIPIQNHNPLDLPNLRRLHKWGKRRHGVDDIAEIASVTRAAPKLAQIRLSNLQPMQSVISALRVAFECDGALEAKNDDEGTELRFPASLEWVAYQNEPDIPMMWTDIGVALTFGSPGEMREKLEDLAKEQKKVIIVPDGTYTIEDCVQDWLDVVKGEEGCWGQLQVSGNTRANSEDHSQDAWNQLFESGDLDIIDMGVCPATRGR